jgi:hypothetical protein
MDGMPSKTPLNTSIPRQRSTEFDSPVIYLQLFGLFGVSFPASQKNFGANGDQMRTLVQPPPPATDAVVSFEKPAINAPLGI